MATADKPQLALATYHSMPGKEAEFLSLIRAHWPVLSRRGLVTMRRPMLSRSTTTPGVFLEVFEWKSPASVDRAHRDPEVQRIWNAMAAIWQKPAATLSRLPECQGQFPHFAVIDLSAPDAIKSIAESEAKRVKAAAAKAAAQAPKPVAPTRPLAPMPARPAPAARPAAAPAPAPKPAAKPAPRPAAKPARPAKPAKKPAKKR